MAESTDITGRDKLAQLLTSLTARLDALETNSTEGEPTDIKPESTETTETTEPKEETTVEETIKDSNEPEAETGGIDDDISDEEAEQLIKDLNL